MTDSTTTEREQAFRKHLAIKGLQESLSHAAAEWRYLEGAAPYDGDTADLLHEICEGLDAADKALAKIRADFYPKGREGA